MPLLAEIQLPETELAETQVAQDQENRKSHPLLKTMERARQLDDHMQMIKLAPDGAEWVSLQLLLTPMGEVLPEQLRRMSARYKAENRRMPASLFFGDYAYVLATLTSVCYLLDYRVPRLTPDSVWTTFDENGYVSGVALSSCHFAALAGDPAANHADCEILPSLDALQEYLLKQVSDCLQPLTQATRANSTLGIPAMWALAADYLASSSYYAGHMIKDDARGLELARQLSARHSPLRRKRDFIHIEECGLHYEMVDRVSCCLYYQAKEDAHYCSSCPHRPQEERIDLYKKWLAGRAATEQ